MSNLRRSIIEWFGGYPDFDSALTALKKTDDVTAKNALLTEAVKKLFNTISADDVLHQNDKGEWIFLKNTLTLMELKQMQGEAEFLMRSRLWRVMRVEIRHQLNKKLYEEARITEDVLWGKLLMWYADVERTVLTKLRKIVIPKNDFK